MRLPAVRAHVGIITCAALAALVVGSPFPDPPAEPSARDGIVLSGGETAPPPPSPPSTPSPSRAAPLLARRRRRPALARHRLAERRGRGDGRGAVRLRPDVRRRPAAHRGRRPGDLPRGGAVRGARAAAAVLSRLRRPAGDRPVDRVDGLGRLHHRLQPRARPGLRRARPHRRPARVGRSGARGTFRTAAERRQPVVVDAAGVQVGIVAGTYGLNGFPLPEGREWSVSMLDVPDLLRQARAARRAGAEVVVVHLHAGYEYDELPSPEQLDAVEQLTASPLVDLVIGDHAHTVQPITRVNGKWVVYGMGNLVAQQEVSRPETYRGLLARSSSSRRPAAASRCGARRTSPSGWNNIASGPIRVRVLDDPGDEATRAAVVAAVNGLGRLRSAGRLRRRAWSRPATRRCRRSRRGRSRRPRRSGRRRRCRRT